MHAHATICGQAHTAFAPIASELTVARRADVVATSPPQLAQELAARFPQPAG